MKTSMKTRGALVGSSVLLAALSSACCWLPLLAVALGFSAVGVGSIFEAYRWPLVALAVALIVVGAVFQRRQRRACAQDGCPPPRRNRFLTPLLGGVFVVLFAVIPEGLAWITPNAATRRADASSTLTRAYSVTGMTCEGCTSLLDSSLEDQPEIENATVTYSEARVQVEFVAGTTTTEADRVMDRVSADWEGKYAFSEAASVS